MAVLIVLMLVHAFSALMEDIYQVLVLQPLVNHALLSVQLVHLRVFVLNAILVIIWMELLVFCVNQTVKTA